MVGRLVSVVQNKGGKAGCSETHIKGRGERRYSELLWYA